MNRNTAPRRANGTFEKTRLVSWTPANWDDGFVRPDGYFAVYLPEHPAATNSGWVRRHHAIYWLLTGKTVPDGVDLHHVDEDKLNDDFGNLELMAHDVHAALSNKEKHIQAQVRRVCQRCGCIFHLPKWRMKEGVTRGTFCSQECYHAAGGRWYKGGVSI